MATLAAVMVDTPKVAATEAENTFLVVLVQADAATPATPCTTANWTAVRVPANGAKVGMAVGVRDMDGATVG